MVAGFGRLIKYEGASAPLPPAAQHNSDFPATNQMALVMALHPHCPCSRASVGELLKIYSHAPGKFALTLLVYKPKDESDDWLKSRTVDSLARLNPRIVVDLDGAEAAKLGLATSGQILLYDRNGALRYNGGVTSSRGHSGDNNGETAVIALLNGQSSPTLLSAPVFGCSLSNKTP